MRVIVYAPSVRGVVRTGRAVARELRNQGHEVAGITDSPALAHAAYETGAVDRIAGRQRHLLELANAYTFSRTPWALVVDRPSRGPARAGAWLLPVPGLVDWARRRPGWVAVAGVAVGVAGAALLLPHPSRVRPDAAPPAASVAPSQVPPPPLSPPSAPPVLPPVRPSPTRPPTRPPATTAGAGSVTTQAAEPAGEGAGEVVLPSPTPSPSTPLLSPTPSPSATCVLQLRLPRVVDVRLCAHRP